MDSIETVKHLEVKLHQPEVRSDPTRLNMLLHESFVECGRSGRIYKRNDILEELLGDEAVASVWSQGFAAEEISEGVILLTYLSAHINSEGELSRHTFRSSLWQLSPQGWQVRFHQGTPIDAFIQRAT